MSKQPSLRSSQSLWQEGRGRTDLKNGNREGRGRIAATTESHVRFPEVSNQRFNRTKYSFWRFCSVLWQMLLVYDTNPGLRRASRDSIQKISSFILVCHKSRARERELYIKFWGRMAKTETTTGCSTAQEKAVFIFNGRDGNWPRLTSWRRCHYRRPELVHGSRLAD